MSNDTLGEIQWEFDTREINREKIFSVIEPEGVLSEDYNSKCTIRFTFTPQEKKKYTSKIVLYILDKEINKMIPYKELTLEGEGLHPRLYFDKKELILPIVPLGFESNLKFKIANEGYENTKVTHKIFPEQLERDKIMKVTYLDGQDIGILRPELRMEISFINNKPLSLTCKLTFYDENNKETSILVAATTDNCLFTNFSFIQRNVSNTEIIEDNDVINLKLSSEIEDEKNLDDNQSVASHVSSAMTKNSCVVGYNRVSQKILKENCEYIQQYLSYACPNVSTSIRNFPEDLFTKENGDDIVYELIYMFTGKNYPPKILKKEDDFNKSVIQIKNQYDILIRFLQGEGAFLNTIFPEYLMEFSKYKKYLEGDPNTAKLLPTNWAKNKRLKSIHKYINTESWILLIYQILKIYYLNRVTLKNFKQSIMHLKEEEQLNFLTNMKITSSNVYSTPEQLLLKWLQINYDKQYPNNPLKVINFSENLQSLQVWTGVILAYLPKAEEEFKVQRKKQNDSKFHINSGKIMEILSGYGVNTHILESHIQNPTAREMLLFTAMLYQNLQLFIPKDTITFKCILGETVVKNIKLKNEHKRDKISYFIKKEGADDFILNNQPNSGNQGNMMGNLPVVELGPDEEKEFPITFKSRISTPQEGKIYFLSKNETNSLQAAPMIFNLLSQINGRRSIGETQYCQSYMYKPFVKKLVVKCPFAIKDRVDFQVTLEIRKKPLPEKKAKKTKVTKVVKKVEEEPLLYRVFYTKQDEEKFTTRLEVDKEKEIPITFLPIDLDVYECNVVFLNERLGEFQYTIEGQGLMPEPKRIDPPHECLIDEPTKFYIDIEPYNRNLEASLKILRLDKTATKKQSKKDLKPIKNSGVEKLNFTVETNKTFFIVPSVLNLQSNKEEEKSLKEQMSSKERELGQSSNSLLNLNHSQKNDFKLEVKCLSKICQEIEGDITLRNIDKPNDIRVYRVAVKVKPKQITALLEFVCPVGMEITQKIPIYNSSEKEWIIKASLNDNFGYFSGPSEKKIGKMMTDYYVLKFTPTEKKREKVIGKLVLSNEFTKETYKYDLNGKIEEPLAEGDFSIECNAKEVKTIKIEFNNPTDNDLTYNVESDLTDIISGKQTFIVKRNSLYIYDLVVKPLLGQIYFGQITFKDNFGCNKWYTIRVDAHRVPQSQVIEMRTDIRKIIFFDFTLDNPTNEYIIFRIDYEGEFLFGQRELRIEPNKEGVYQLYFAPLKVGVFEGSMHIFNESVGEFLYKLKLICEKSSPIFPETLQAELGKSFDLPIFLENPIGEEVEVFPTNNNVVNFTVIPEKIYISAYTQKEVIVRYTPSSLDYEDEAAIVFETTKIGKWEYFFKGKGKLPTKMNSTMVSTYIGGITSGIINFKNPFRDTLNLTIELKCDEQDDTFRLINKKGNKFTVDAFRVLQIPFTFSPKKLTRYKAEIKVMVNRSLFWIYPIEGITEVKSKGIDFVFKTKAKKLYEKKIILDLSDSPDSESDKDLPIVNIRIKEEKYKVLVEKCLTVGEYEVIEKDEKGMSIPKKLSIKIKFYPLRPFKTESEFIITKSTGGQWIYNVILESIEPDPDDIINIQSSLNKVSQVSFRLHNLFTKNAKFVAYFSHDSSAEFAVTPKDGTLDQSGKDGTTFLVSYLPVEYGKVKIGKLIVETDEIQWIFIVNGTHNDYKPPENIKSDIHKLTQTAQNHIALNVSVMNKTGMNFKKRELSAIKKTRGFSGVRTIIKTNPSRSVSKSPKDNKKKKY